MQLEKQIHAANGKLGSARRWHPENHEAIRDLEREAAALRIAAYAEKVAASAPPLTSEQTDRVVAILRAGAR